MNTECSKFMKVVSQTNYRPNARIVLGLLLLYRIILNFRDIEGNIMFLMQSTRK